MYMTEIFVFVLGTIIGSAINALDWRWGGEVSWLSARSRCPHCERKLSAWELIPILSFFFLRGRCRGCQEKISPHYTLVELASGGLFLLSYSTFGLTVTAGFSALISAILLLLYLHDGRTFVLPDSIVWSFDGLALLSIFFRDTLALPPAQFADSTLLFLAAGPALALPLTALWYFSKGKAMGLGDAKLTIGIGWLLGPALGLSAIVFSFWIGAGVSLALLAFFRLWKSTSPNQEERLTMKSAVPLGPFLILGFLLSYFGGLSLF